MYPSTISRPSRRKLLLAAGLVVLAIVAVVLMLPGSQGGRHQSTLAPGGSGAGQAAKSNRQRQVLISDWAVRLPNNSNETFEYAALPDSEIGLTTRGLLKTDPNCSAQNAAAGRLKRMLPTDSFDDDMTAQDVADEGTLPYAQAGGYYYFYIEPTDSCANDFSALQTASDQQSTAAQQLRTLLPSLTTTK